LAGSAEKLASTALVSECFLGWADANSYGFAPLAKTSAESGQIHAARMADLPGSIFHKSLQRNDNAFDSMVAGTVGARDHVLGQPA